MKPIVAPIRPNDHRFEVANLKAALDVLVHRGALRVAEGRLDELLRTLEIGGWRPFAPLGDEQRQTTKAQPLSGRDGNR